MIDFNDIDGENIYMDSPVEFQMFTKFLPLEETGLYFHNELELGDGTSVITEKKVPIGEAEDTIKTYHKVVDMVELTEVEKSKMNQVRQFLKKLFEVFFRGKKGLVAFTLLYSLFLGVNIATSDWFGIFIDLAVILIWNDPIKFIKEIKRMIDSHKSKDVVIDELSKLGINRSLLSIPKEDIKFYYKTRIN